jgi:putative phosphonate metabolism protein
MSQVNKNTMNGHQSEAFEWTAKSRFAIYYAPSRQSPWWDAGCRWLARDPESGTELAPPVIPALATLSRDVASLSRSPQRYGWHGTLVAPARCAPSAAPEEILSRARAWALRQRPFDLDVEAASLDQFVAIRPATADGAAAMHALAADALHEFAPLRAMPSESERSRRLQANLTARQRELLDRWGYPYVLDEFRFHMTLSDSIDSHDRQVLLDWWRTQLPALGPLRIDGAALFIEREPGKPFVLARRLPFGDAQ